MQQFKYFKPPFVHIGSHESNRDKALERAASREAFSARAPNDHVRNWAIERRDEALEEACYYDDLLEKSRKQLERYGSYYKNHSY